MPGNKLTNMMWRSMAESALLGFVLFGVMGYMLYAYGFELPFASLASGMKAVLVALCVFVGAGAVYGYWSSSRTVRRLEQLRESMLLLEKGTLNRPVPALGEDELGRLGDQLERISRKWEEQVSSLQRLSNNNAELAERARISAIIEERQRLARELHDAVSQQLFAISMTATAVGRIFDRDVDKARRQITLIEEMSSVAQSEMRALLLHLRPVHLEGKSLTDGLGELLHELNVKTPIDIVWEMDKDIQLARGIEDHLFRIVQEALSNALRHSKATRLEVRMLRRPDSVKLSVKDNGIGFELEMKKHTSYGLVSMRERVNEIGGSIEFVTAPGKGTRIDIRVPLMAVSSSVKMEAMDNE